MGRSPTPLDEADDGEVPADLATVAEFDSGDVTPTDRPIPYTKVPQRGTRKRLLEGGGDYCIYALTDHHENLPQGSLVPVEGVPRFDSVKRAKAWLQNQSGDLLANRQVIIFRAIELINVAVAITKRVTLIEKQKTIVNRNGGQEALDA